jgi:hypothetical protein
MLVRSLRLFYIVDNVVGIAWQSQVFGLIVLKVTEGYLALFNEAISSASEGC